MSKPELFVAVDATDSTPLNRQVYEQIRRAILSGALRPGDRLPSSRRLAAQLTVSRTVVVNAYDLLFADGFINGQQGSATLVSDAVTAIVDDAVDAPAATPSFAREVPPLTGPRAKGATRVRYDFRPSLPSWDAFPTGRWSRAMQNALTRAQQEDIGYGAAEGVPSFRAAIAWHVRLHRGVACDAADVVVTSGATQAIDLIARTVMGAGDVVVLEDPTHPVLRQVFANNAARVVAAPVDEDGLSLQAIENALAAQGISADEVRLLYLTPGHQFPTGGVMPLARRAELIHWARHHDVLIIEDDYDSDFTFGHPQPAALAGLDPSVVAHVGTFSKTMYPALRLGYVVLPPAILGRVVAQKWLTDRMTETVGQLAMTEYMMSGNYDAHLERMNELYASRHGVFTQAMTVRFGSALSLLGAPKGLHVMARLQVDRSTDAIVARAAKLGAKLHPCHGFWVGSEPQGAAFLFGYCALPADEITNAVDIVYAAAL